jgi:hypothetical protein
VPVPTKTPMLLDAETSALPVADSAASMFERLASTPGLAVESLERLMALWERTEARKAETAFNTAMAAAQNEMRPVAADAWNPQTKSKYASYEALDRALRPTYTKHGFALSFNTGDSKQPDHVLVICEATHLGGHSKHYQVDMPADGKGAKGGDVMTKTHATGSAITYGMRYLLKAIFNIAVGDGDDDGNRAGRTQQPAKDAPTGYDDWLADMSSAADEGWPKLSKAFGDSKPEYRKHLTGADKEKWSALRQKAEKVAK